jgi:hypothetical protein
MKMKTTKQELKTKISKIELTSLAGFSRNEFGEFTPLQLLHYFPLSLVYG